MHTHSETKASLAEGVVDRIIQLDEMLKLALSDQDDHAKLQERIAALDPSEVRHILALFGVKPAPAIEDVKESPANVA